MALDLSAANEAALADIAALDTPTPAPAETPVVEATAPETPVVEDPVDPSPQAETPAPEAQAPPADPPDEPVIQKWTFTRKGQTVEITDPAQAHELIRQGYDYTQKTMELADIRRQMETRYREVFSDPRLLRAQLAELERLQGPPPPQAPQEDPTDLVTVERHQQLLQAQLAEAQRQTQAYVQAALLKAETARYTEEYSTEVTRVMTTLTNEKFPILKDVDKIEKLILDDVSEQVAARIAMDPDKPVPIAEVKTLIAQSAEKRATKLQARVKEHQKMEAVRAAKVTKQGIEPAGGSPPVVKAGPPLKLGDPRLVELAIADMQAAISKK